jgi:hypothetical protein
MMRGKIKKLGNAGVSSMNRTRSIRKTLVGQRRAHLTMSKGSYEVAVSMLPPTSCAIEREYDKSPSPTVKILRPRSYIVEFGAPFMSPSAGKIKRQNTNKLTAW